MNKECSHICPLCNNVSRKFYEKKWHLFYQCDRCFAVFRDREHFPGSEAEQSRYLEHNNDVNDPRYRKFVEPIVNEILQDFGSDDYGLDFGAGTGPVISHVLKENNYRVEQYDPFFYNYPGLLKKKYDYIVCCEVIEHFHHPRKEFELLKDILLPGGKLYCMTDLFYDGIDFNRWYYKNDPTHVFLYHHKTLEWIRDNLGFTDLNVYGRVIVLQP